MIDPQLFNILFLLCMFCLMDLYTTRRVTLDNTKLPHDTRGLPLITGEADVLVHDGSMYFYFNNWGGCTGVNCCNSTSGCASCCFAGPNDPCVYTNNHSVVVYKTSDLEKWNYMGEALPLGARHIGIEFRPHVVFNKATNLFVMWYEDRWHGQSGYGVATSSTPEGPFKTISDTVHMTTKDKIGDFDIFVDEDGNAYHVRTGFVIEKLNATYTGVSGETYHFSTPKPSEGPVMFKRSDLYYILPGTGCCSCIGGSSIYVLISKNPMGPYTFQGDVGSNPDHHFDKHSPNNYVTKSQASAVFSVKHSNGTTLVWLGNQWVTSQFPGAPRNHDLLYFTTLPFTVNGSISQLQWHNTITIDVL